MRSLLSYITGVCLLASLMFVGGAWTPTEVAGMVPVSIHPTHATFALAAQIDGPAAASEGGATVNPGCDIPKVGATCVTVAVAGGLDVPVEPAEPEPSEPQRTVQASPAPAPTPPPTTAPAPTPPPAPETRWLTPVSVEAWRPLVSTYFAAGDVERALRVIACESSGDPNAANPRSSARGLFQHLGRFWPERSVAAGWAGADILDPTANVAVAAWLVYEGGGWSHWNPSRHCWG